MKRGEVYYIHRDNNFNSTGSEMQSGRPAIIVSTNLLNTSSPVVEIVYLTTQPKSDMHTHISIHSTLRESTALCEQITSVSTSRLGNYMCTLTDEEMQLIDCALAVGLGLTFDTEPAETEEYEDDCSCNEEIIRVTAERDCYKQMLENLIGVRR